MKNRKLDRKEESVEVDDLEFDKFYSKFRESKSKAVRRRQTKRKLDRLKEKQWLKQNYYYDDDYLFDFDDAKA